jgi:hypothetical protein
MKELRIFLHRLAHPTNSHKQVPANIYPANNSEVEAGVKEYCITKAFRHCDIDLIAYSAFQIDELHRYNQNLVGTLHVTSLLWSTDMKTAV